MDKESYRQGVKDGLDAAVSVVEQLAANIKAADAEASQWTLEVAKYLRQAKVEDMPTTAKG